jgi:hypothetical protein
MSVTLGRAVAVASIEDSMWSWELKVDERCGLFRWYLNGIVETNLRGCTLEQAEAAVRRFVDHSLRGELKIAYAIERIGPDSERGHSAVESSSAG